MLPINGNSPRCLIPIHIETLTGTSFELLVSPHEQVQYIKRKIERREGIPMSQQHLIWRSTELDDESCLNDYQIGAGTTLKLVLMMRGGPVNTRRIPIEDSLIRDMSDYIDHTREDELIPSSNKNVTFLVLRDGDQFNFFQVIDRGDGTLSPLSGSMSATSMYNAHDTVTVESNREYDEKRQADDQKTKEKMELIRSKLKTHTRKDFLHSPRPPSSSKQSKSTLIHHHRRSIRIDTSSNLNTNAEASSAISSLEQQYRPLSYSYATTNLFNNYNLLATSTIHQHDLVQEEDSDDEDDDDDDESHDDDDEAKHQHQPVFASRSLSPSVFYQNSPSIPTTDLKPLLSQDSTTPTATSITDTNSNAVLVDYQQSPKDSTPEKSPASLELIDEISGDGQSRNETALSKTLWTDDDEQMNLPEERTSTSRSMLLRHQISATTTSLLTPITPILSSKSRKPSLPSHHHHHKTLLHEQQTNKSSSSSSRPLIPLSLSKYRRIPANIQLNNSSKQQATSIGATPTSTMTPTLDTNPTIPVPPNSLNESPVLNKRLETLKTPAKQSTGTIPPTPPATMLPLDSTKVTIETIGPKTVSALLRQHATIEPVDTSRGVGKHLVSLLTTASKETASMRNVQNKQTSHETVIEERFKLDSKLNHSWTNVTNTNPSTVSSSFQSNAATIYNTNKLPPVVINRKSTSKCFLCKKKTGLATTYQCRCGSSFCSEHRYPEAHACAFDYKAEGKRLIERNNPLVSAPKLPKI